MKKQHPTRYSSAVGEVLVMITFKIKYCHNIFDIVAVRHLIEQLIRQACTIYKIDCRKMTFDSDHVHMIVDMGLHSKPELAKKIKGYTARHFFLQMPHMKKKYFWGSGLWNPAYDIRSMHDVGFYERYLDKQKYAPIGQTQLSIY